MAQYLIYHLIALVAGVILDWIVGDPYWMPHPIRLIGRLISVIDKTFLKSKDKGISSPLKEKILGAFMWLIVIGSTFIVSAFVMVVTYRLNLYLGIATEAILTCYILAARGLCYESMKVKKSLDCGLIEEARINVSMIVGRDTDCLDETGVAKAAVETVAENTSDGVIAPLLYVALGGPILGMMYKAVNTMDSMVGYHNDRYEDFGYFPARLDDVFNYLPSRISAVFMIAGCFLVSAFDNYYSGADGFRIWRRDRRNHKSPNSAQTESACAGCLGIKLAGDASYFGEIVKKPTIGDAQREIEYEDIRRASVLMFLSEIVCLISVIIIAGIIYGFVN